MDSSLTTKKCVQVLRTGESTEDEASKRLAMGSTLMARLKALTVHSKLAHRQRRRYDVRTPQLRWIQWAQKRPGFNLFLNKLGPHRCVRTSIWKSSFAPLATCFWCTVL